MSAVIDEPDGQRAELDRVELFFDGVLSWLVFNVQAELLASHAADAAEAAKP